MNEDTVFSSQKTYSIQFSTHLIHNRSLPLLKVEMSGLTMDLLMDPLVGLMRMVTAKLLMILFCLVLMMDYGMAQVLEKK